MSVNQQNNNDTQIINPEIAEVLRAAEEIGCLDEYISFTPLHKAAENGDIEAARTIIYPPKSEGCLATSSPPSSDTVHNDKCSSDATTATCATSPQHPKNHPARPTPAPLLPLPLHATTDTSSRGVVNAATANFRLTPLMLAVSKGNADFVDFLLSTGFVDVNQADSSGESALHYCVATNKNNTTTAHSDGNAADIPSCKSSSTNNNNNNNNNNQRILAALIGAKANLNAQTNTGETPLAIASEASVSNYPAVAALIAAGADVNFANKDGVTPLIKCVSTKQKSESEKEEEEEEKEEGAKPQAEKKEDYKKENDASPPSSSSSSIKIMNALLAAPNIDINAANANGWTALIHAAHFGNTLAAEAIIDHHKNNNNNNDNNSAMVADLNATEGCGWSALGIAIQSGSKGVVRALLRTLHNSNNDDDKDEHGARACQQQRPPIDVNISSLEGVTPLCVAAQVGDAEAARALIAAGANVNTADAEGWTPLNIAALGGHAAVVRALLSASPDVIVDKAEAGAGSTPLMMAAQNGFIDVVELLLGAKAKVAAMDCDGLTAIDFARHNGHVAVLEMLQNAMASAENL